MFYLSDGARVSPGYFGLFSARVYLLLDVPVNTCLGLEQLKHSVRMCARVPALSYLREGALEKVDKLCCTCVLQKLFEGSLK